LYENGELSHETVKISLYNEMLGQLRNEKVHVNDLNMKIAELHALNEQQRENTKRSAEDRDKYVFIYVVEIYIYRYILLLLEIIVYIHSNVCISISIVY
jgi:hypothetical protein